jgi:PAS domain S-box-containing protein
MSVLAVVMAVLLLWMTGFGPGLGIVFFFAVLLSAWYGGIGPGFLTTALVVLLNLSLTLPRRRSGIPITLPWALSLGLFAAGGVLVTLLVEALHSARRRAEESTEEAHRHQETLRESEERLAAILENSPAVVYLKDTQGRYLMVNRRFATLFHVDPSEVIGKTDHDVFPAELADAFQANDRRVIEARGALEFEEVAPHEDGLHTYLSVKFPLFGIDGSISAVCGKSTDITDRKSAEEHRARLGRQAALRADVSMALALGKMSPPNVLQLCAEAEVRHLGVALAQIWTLDESEDTLVLQAGAGNVPGLDDRHHRIPVGKSPIGAIARDRRPRWINEVGKPGQGDHDDRQGWMREGIVGFAGYPLIVEDRLLGVMALFARRAFEDDTLEALAALADLIAQGIERMRLERERIDLLERERKARAEAESANHAKDRFLAVLGHELRTPLAPILANVSAMLAEPGTASEAEVRSVLELTQWGIELESRLIDDLLDMTEINRGRLRIQREVTDAHRLIRHAVEICRAELDAGRLYLVIDLSATGHHVDADPARLEQVFWNLIKNAVKFSPKGGTLTIRTRNEPRPESEGDAPGAAPDLVIEFADTGIGMEPGLLPGIFDAFTQGEGGRVRRFGGLGLGLAICRSVMEAHGGRIGAVSAGTDRGATFTVSLATISEPAVAKTAKAPAAPPRLLKILLVEDDGPTLKIMTRLLGRAPYVVKTANTFATALATATSGDFDLIISDIGLPDGSGLDLMRQIRDRYAARGIALSGYGMEEDIRKSREAGFLAHLTKPVDFHKLQVTIQQITSTPV